MRTQFRIPTLVILGIFAMANVSTAISQSVMSSPLPSLFTDKRAYRVGDLVTILLMEFTEGSNESSTNTKYEHQFNLDAGGTGKLDFIPGLGMSSGLGSDQKAEGGTTRQGSLKGKLSARVMNVLPNGLLKLEGQRVLVVNGEQQLTILTGIVRPKDIQANNSVYSYLIADASITYQGKGVVNNAATPGFFTKLLGWLF